MPDSENGLLVAQMALGCPAHPDAHLENLPQLKFPKSVCLVLDVVT